MTRETIFHLTGVTYRYPETVALDAVSLSILKGERVAVLGANGSGKSTLLRILAGLCFPAAGSLAFCGNAVTEAAFSKVQFSHDFRRRVGVIFQNPDVQLFNPTVFDEVAFGPLQLGWTKKEILDRVDAQLNEMGILHLKHRAPHRLSGGEKKRVALASVMILDPDVLLMDEPTSALDPESQGHIVDFLFDCSGRKTVVTTTHSLDIVEDISDRCIVLERGKLVASGSPAEVLGNQALLARTHLIHAHRHRHSSGLVHSHPLLHRAHDHPHPHG